ncbi:two-component sensor histidine kinase [Vibrio coralliilyticus]|uniref:ATP-binding protein n=1 Tax=Vibrio coralliilyticus TaxID=190893 RepID=UPI000BAB20A8|nr:ATP-binding protein [Vibrio coralliilyticus]PAU37161.1 two-component sensor histidine kinase [Vibrio coralliilyticus]
MVRSTFTKAYISLATGLVITVVAFLTLGSDFMRKTEVEIFLNDGQFFVNQYIEQRGQPNSLYKELTNTGKQHFYIFNLSLVNVKPDTLPCSDCRELYRLKSIPVYLVEDNLYAAVFPLPNSAKSIMFSENRDFFEPQFEWYEDSEVMFVIGLVAWIFVSLGVFVYVPIRHLHNQINQLNRASRRFGRGEFSARIDSDNFRLPLKELAESFNYMADDIEGHVKQSQIYTQAIPHEVRTPLSRIQLASDMARRNAVEEQEAFFDDIDRYVDDISSLTASVVQISRVGGLTERELLDTQNLLPEHWLKQRIDRQEHYNKQISFHASLTEPAPAMDVLETLANLVIDNLLQNAFRYADAAVAITLIGFDNTLVIDIEDDGAGIPKDKYDEIFLAFSRLDESRHSDGFGLGLTIASEAAKRLNWRISLGESELGGARFTVLIEC